MTRRYVNPDRLDSLRNESRSAFLIRIIGLARPRLDQAVELPDAHAKSVRGFPGRSSRISSIIVVI